MSYPNVLPKHRNHNTVCIAPVNKMSGKMLVIVLGIFSMFLRNASSRIFDLTEQLESGIPTYPMVEGFNFTDVFTTDHPFWFAIDNFCMSEHTGTHFDAPYHFNENGWKLQDVPVENLVAPAVLVTIQQKERDTEERYELSVDDILAWEDAYGTIPDNSVVFLFTGWDKYWKNIKKYKCNNQDEYEDVKTPGFTAEVVEWLHENRKIVGIGIDTITIEVGYPKEFPVHRAASAVNYYILENVAGLHQLPPSGATVYVAPISIKDGTGAPMRLLASVPELFFL